MTQHHIEDLIALRQHYAQPKALVLGKQKVALDKYFRQFIALCPFAVLSTANQLGEQDCSPKGGEPGFIQCLNDSTLALPDRAGNNRLDSITNIISNPRIGMLLMIPGFEECLRVNGKAKISVDPTLLERLHKGSTPPLSAIVVSITEIYFHCARSIHKAGLWRPQSQVDRALMPSLGEILKQQLADKGT